MRIVKWFFMLALAMSGAVYGHRINDSAPTAAEFRAFAADAFDKSKTSSIAWYKSHGTNLPDDAEIIAINNLSCKFLGNFHVGHDFYKSYECHFVEVYGNGSKVYFSDDWENPDFIQNVKSRAIEIAPPRVG